MTNVYLQGYFKRGKIAFFTIKYCFPVKEFKYFLIIFRCLSYFWFSYFGQNLFFNGKLKNYFC